MTYTDYPSRSTWLKGRLNGIGASEAAAAIGISTFMSQTDLYNLKRSDRAVKEIQNDLTRYGTDAEEHLRALFALKHEQEYEVVYHPFRIYRADEPYDYMTATLDGELLRKSDGAQGVYECKTKKVQSRGALDDWNGRIPQTYYCQLCHQLYVTGYKFAVLNAELRFSDNTAEIREYVLNREDCEDDIKYMADKEREFWGFVTSGTRPPVSMTL